MYDLAIIGGGPAGGAAGGYAARKRLKTILIAEVIGGQSTESVDVQNWIGTPHISGAAMAKQMEAHLREDASDMLQIKLGERADKVEAAGDHFPAHTTKSIYPAKTVLITTGGSRKKLDAKGAAEFENKGVTYCASCDGPLFAGQDVAVEVKGDTFVKALVVKDNASGALTELPVAGIFVEIGMLPATGLVQGLVALDEWNKIKVDAKNQRASVPGIWAAGDCTDGLYHQNNIAAGDAVKALEDIYYFLKAAK